MKKYIPTSVLKLMNVMLVVVPFFLCWILYYEPRTITVHSGQSTTIMIMLYALAYYEVAKRLDAYRYVIMRAGDLAFSQIVAVGVTDGIAAVVIWMISVHFPNLLPGLCCFGFQVVVIVAYCVFAHRYYFAHHIPKKTIVIYDVRQGMEQLISAYGLDKRYCLTGSYTVEEACANLGYLDAAESVFLCGIHSHDRNIIVKHCVDKGIEVFVIPRMGDVIMDSAERMHMCHLPFLRVSRYKPPKEYLVIKRVFDIVLSGIALLLLSPLMGLVALLVKLDGGPAFYKQVRLTKDGKQFRILKFRSMIVDAEKYSGAVLCAGENDPRITKVGRIIRACRLDELPQLWNIFVGDMSIVGPRPERPELAAEFEKEFAEYRLRLQAKAGLTGYAQVYGKYNTTAYDKVLMDLMYIAKPSLMEDLVIMLATIRILFSKESTEGVGAETVELKYELRSMRNRQR